MLEWIPTLVFGTAAAAIVAANWLEVVRAWRAAQREGSARFSPSPLIGGLFGAFAVMYCPIDGLTAWLWVPALIDPGCAGYLLAAVFATLEAKRARRTALTETRAAHESSPLARALAGSMLGTAVGDALGLACEGLSPGRQMKLYPSLDRYGFLFGHGMISDDTEHTVMVAQALIESGGEEDRFARDFAWRLKGWLLALPAGIGMATGRAIIKLLLFIPPRWSGVKSAGNGPAMRAAVLGVAFGDDRGKLVRLNRISARITHRDDRAEHGALAVAVAAHLSASSGVPVTAHGFATTMSALLPADSATLATIHAVAASLEQGQPAGDFVTGLGSKNGVSGYMLHTLPAVLHVWLRHQDDYAGGVTEMIRLGGDADSTAAIVGGIIGARVGPEGIPPALRSKLIDWPRSPATIDKVARRLAHARLSGTPMREVRCFIFAAPLRNLFFLAVVLAHGFRRLLPPY